MRVNPTTHPYVTAYICSIHKIHSLFFSINNFKRVLSNNNHHHHHHHLKSVHFEGIKYFKMKFGIVFPMYNTPAFKDHLGENDKSFIWDRINKYKDYRKDSSLPYVSRKNKYKFFCLVEMKNGRREKYCVKLPSCLIT